MKWILVFFAIWNVAGALLRTFRLALEKLRLTRRWYPNRDLRPLDEVSDLELSPDARARYCAAVRELSGMAGIPEPQLLCSPKATMLAGTRGWVRHQLQLSRGALRHATDEELLAILAHEFGHIYYRHFAALRMVELFAAAMYARVVFSLWHMSFAWYAYLGIWSLLDFSFSLFRLAAGQRDGTDGGSLRREQAGPGRRAIARLDARSVRQRRHRVRPDHALLSHRQTPGAIARPVRGSHGACAGLYF